MSLESFPRKNRPPPTWLPWLSLRLIHIKFSIKFRNLVNQYFIVPKLWVPELPDEYFLREKKNEMKIELSGMVGTQLDHRKIRSLNTQGEWNAISPGKSNFGIVINFHLQHIGEYPRSRSPAPLPASRRAVLWLPPTHEKQPDTRPASSARS